MIKKLNNTELGKGGTHDTYVLIPNDLEISDIFDSPNTIIEFVDQESGNCISVRNTVGREKRIVGLGQYYRDKELSAGDEIIFERQEVNNSVHYFIKVQKHDDTLVIQKSKYGFEILTADRLTSFKELCEQTGTNLEIIFLTAEKKRNDSPEKTNFYNVLLDGVSLLESCSGKEIKELSLDGRTMKFTSFYGWKKYVFEMED